MEKKTQSLSQKGVGVREQNFRMEQGKQVKALRPSYRRVWTGWRDRVMTWQTRSDGKEQKETIGMADVTRKNLELGGLLETETVTHGGGEEILHLDYWRKRKSAS